MKRGLLADKPGGKHGIEIVSGSVAPQGGFVRKRKERLPCGHGYFADLAGIEVRHNDPRVSHAGPVVTLIESRLRGFQQKPWRRRCEVRILQLLFGRGIESNGPKRLCARPAVLRGNRNRLVALTKPPRRRDFL